MLRGLLYYGTLIGLAGASLWLLASLRDSLQRDSAQPPQGPILTLDNFTAIRMNAQGVRQYTLNAPHLEELPDDGGTEVNRPRFEIYRDADTRDWLIEAERGWLSTDQELVVLRQNVAAFRAATADQPPVTIHSRDLLYRPQPNLLSSDAAVRMSTPNSWLSGTGMRADLNTHRLRLLWNVRGEYAPPVD